MTIQKIIYLKLYLNEPTNITLKNTLRTRASWRLFPKGMGSNPARFNIFKRFKKKSSIRSVE